MRVVRGLAVLIAVLAVGAPAASAAPPPNDNRADAEVVTLPADIEGTTAEATRQEAEPESGCATETGSVWYRVTPERAGRIVLSLAASGDMDAVVDVYRVRRSQLEPIRCEATDEEGRSAFSVNVRADQTYLIRVARLTNSTAEAFRLRLQLGQPPARPPGRPLPREGASGTLNSVLIPSVAWSVRLRPGVTYRFNLASGSCTPLSFYAPGTESFGERPIRYLRCGGYFTFTPDIGEGGRYSLLAEAPGRRGNASYRLTAARAGRDDTAPGHFIGNYARATGHLNAKRIDVVDLYRFDVRRRSDLRLRLASDERFEVRLISSRGKRIARAFAGEDINVDVPRGRYFAAVRARRGASGDYRLARLSRTITRTRVTVDGSRKPKPVEPGDAVTLGAHVLPGVRGPVQFQIQRYDPLTGWQFYRARRDGAARRTGRAAVRFKPPTVGRWRVKAFFLGTRASSPSRSRWREWRVQGPLEE